VPRSIAIVDANALYAAVDRSEQDNARAAAELARDDLDLVIPLLAVLETAQLIEARRGASAEAAFIRGVSGLRIEAPFGQDWPRIADLLDRYVDLRLGTADASIVALAERLGADTIITFDRRHFGVVRPRHCAAFRLLPE
jgi:predicted nucleic acid-binding protein